jgi:hypothetical protein
MPRIIALAVLLSVASAGAGEFHEALSGADLVKLCEGSKEIPPTCAAYIDGVRSGMRTYRLFVGWSFKEAKTEPPAAVAPVLAGDPFCIPAGTSPGDVVKAVIAFVKNYAPAAKEPASLSIVTALREAYPCDPEAKK